MPPSGRLPAALLGCLALGLVVRHDIPDRRFIELARDYPQLCHFPMGEGTLVAGSWVLTAGHVGRDLRRDLEKGYAPTLRCNGAEHRIAAVVVHPGFRDTESGMEHDVALVRLEDSVAGVRPAQIYRDRDEAGMQIVIAGAGHVGNGRTGPQHRDRIARAATNRVDSTDSLWVSFAFDPPESASATPLEGVSGPGDSGGPAFCERDGVRYIVGVSSHQKSANGKGRYGATEFYSRVSVESGWILRTIAQ